MRRKPSRKSIRKKRITTKRLDDVFRDIIRYPGRCSRCGQTYNLQCAHGFSRRYRGTRWEEEANFCLCNKCHLFFTFRPLEWTNWMRAAWGSEKYERLRRQALAITKTDKEDLYLRLKARLEELNEAS